MDPQTPVGAMPPRPASGKMSAEITLASRAGLSVVALIAGASYVGESFNRYLGNDDYAMLYTAWQESLHKVPGRDFVVYSDHAIEHPLALLMRWFPESFAPLYSLRLAMVACLGAIGVFVFRITGRLCGPRSAWFAPPLFALSVLVLNRALDARSDLVTTLLWILAFDMLTKSATDPDAGEENTTRDLVKLGVVLGLMPVNFFKAALALPFFFACIALKGIFLPSTRTGGRSWRVFSDLAIAGGASLVPAALYLGYLGASGALPSVIAASKAFAGTIAGAPDPAVPRAESFRLLLEHDPWICIGLGAGVILRVDDAKDHSIAANAGVFSLLALAAASVMLNPSYYAYNFVTLLPLLAPFGGYACARLVTYAEQTPFRAWLAPLTALAVFLVPLVRRLETLFDIGAMPSNTHQLALRRYLLDYVPADQGLFALDGVGVFRPSVVHFWLTFLTRPRYEAGEFSYEAELRARPAALVLKSYRLPGWLTPADRSFLRSHYVDLNGDFMLPGAELPDPGEAHVELLVGGVYDVTTGCRLDGVVATGAPERLEAGGHALSGDRPCIVRLHVDHAARALLEVPTAVPYLSGPDYIVR